MRWNRGRGIRAPLAVAELNFKHAVPQHLNNSPHLIAKKIPIWKSLLQRHHIE